MTPCYSARFIQPFAELLATNERFDRESLAQMRAIDPSSRIPIDVAHRMLLDQLAQTNDPELGVKAGQLAGLGSGGALDYAMHSASTVRSALEMAARYTRLFSDSARVGFDVQGSRALVRLSASVPAPRAIPDFAMAYWFINHTRLPLGQSPKIECFFEHDKPTDTSAYERTYGSAALHFGAPFYGVTFDREYLDAPLSTADSSVHQLLCDHVESMMSRLDGRVSVTSRVREIVTRELFDGSPSLVGTAKQLRMSTRTLAAKLGREGTTFSTILDDARRELALRYLGHREVSHAEIAFRLGFAHVEGFYRAFKRWTGTTPLTYRRSLSSAPPPTPRFPDTKH